MWKVLGLSMLFFSGMGKTRPTPLSFDTLFPVSTFEKLCSWSGQMLSLVEQCPAIKAKQQEQLRQLMLVYLGELYCLGRNKALVLQDDLVYADYLLSTIKDRYITTCITGSEEGSVVLYLLDDAIKKLRSNVSVTR